MKFKNKLFTSIVTILFCFTAAYVTPSISQEIADTIIKQEVNEDFNKQLACLTKNIYYEAATESYEGKLAVAHLRLMSKDKASTSYHKSLIFFLYL